MRSPQRIVPQGASIFDRFAGREIGRELKAMSAWLDGHRELLGQRSVAGSRIGRLGDRDGFARQRGLVAGQAVRLDYPAQQTVVQDYIHAIEDAEERVVRRIRACSAG